MHVQFSNPGFQYMLDSIMEFQKDDTTTYWNDTLFYFYKELNKEYAYGLSYEKRKEYLSEKLCEIYEANEILIQEKVNTYNEYWKLYEKQITQAFSDAFGIECENEFNDLICNISLNPVSPRYLKQHSFDVFYLNSEKGALGNALHEIVHFLWFQVWNQVFGDSYNEYETPSLKWILSEMVVESILRDERLSSINPYFPREQGGCVYPYFFTMKVKGEYILDTLDEMYRNMDIHEFMKKSYGYCLENETEIREHIKVAESM